MCYIIRLTQKTSARYASTIMINVVGAAEPIAPSTHTEVVAPTPTPEPIQPAPSPASSSTASPIITPPAPMKKAPDRKKMQLIIGGIFLLLLVVGGGVALVLTKTNQDLRQQASGTQSYACTPAGLANCRQLGFDSCIGAGTCIRTTAAATPTVRPPNNSNNPTPRPTSPPLSPSAILTRTPIRIPTRPASGTPAPTSPNEPPSSDPAPTITLTSLAAVIDPTEQPAEEPTDPPENPEATEKPALENLGAGLSPTPTLVKTTSSCNESCTTSENCRNPSHICSEGVCRLESNPEDTNCRLPSGGTQIALDPTQASRVYTPEAEPEGETPVSGPADWLLYLQIGAGFLGLGTLALLFL